MPTGPLSARAGADLTGRFQDTPRVPGRDPGLLGDIFTAVQSREIAGRIQRDTCLGQELVPRPRRLALRHSFQRGLEPESTFGDSIHEAPSRRRCTAAVVRHGTSTP